jgi:hypothetical protein
MNFFITSNLLLQGEIFLSQPKVTEFYRVDENSRQYSIKIAQTVYLFERHNLGYFYTLGGATQIRTGG